MAVAVVVRRRRGAWRDRLRRYRVVIDGETVAMLRNGGRAEIEVGPGTHTIQIRIDWSGSPEHEFSAEPGDEITFECGPAGNALEFAQGFTKDRYIDLERLA